MRLLCISDLHGNRKALKRILHAAGEVEAVLLAGDITHFGTGDQAEELVKVARAECPVVMAVAGNCDSAAIDRRLVELGVSLMGRANVLDGVGFYGVSSTPPWQDWMYELTEEQIAAALAAGREQLGGVAQQVVLAHAPPHGTVVDRTRWGKHVGSKALRALIDEAKPAAVVCGHIHEAPGVERIGDTTVVNAGPGGRGRYAKIELHEGVEVQLHRV